MNYILNDYYADWLRVIVEKKTKETSTLYYVKERIEQLTQHVEMHFIRKMVYGLMCRPPTSTQKLNCRKKPLQIIAKGLLENKSNYQGFLTLSMMSKNEEFFKFLLSYNADPNDAFAAYYAVVYDQVHLLKLMFDYGAELRKMNFSFIIGKSTSLSNMDGLNVFMQRVLYHDIPDAFDCLLENCFDVNAYKDGENPCLLSAVHELCQWSEREEGDKSSESAHAGHVRMLKKVLKYIVVQMEVGTAPIKESTLKTIEGSESIKKSFKNFSMQVSQMKFTPVLENSRVTYFDLFTKKGKSLLRLCDKKIVDEVLAGKKKNLFPDFNEELKTNVQRGFFQRNISDSFKETLYDILQEKLTFDTICNICEYVEIKDLTAFALRDFQTSKQSSTI